MADLTMRCQNCGRPFQAKQGRRRYCGDPCRWAAWKRRREEAARAPVERALRSLVAKVEEAVQEALRELGGTGE